MTTTEPDPTPDITQSKPPRALRTGRRVMPAGHAILAMVVAFSLGTLLNADSMLQTARTQTLGSKRHSIGVAVMRPIHAVSEFLRLDRPRRAIDRAAGHAPPPTPKKIR